MIDRKSILIHIPHSSVRIPDSNRRGILLSDVELEAELLRITDRYTDELFSINGVATHRNRVSRLVMDPERFRSDHDEPMASKGMGFAYIKTSNGTRLRNLSDVDREAILHDLYDPYHAELTEKVDKILDECGTCLIVDAHSFPSKALPYEDDQSHDRPDICLGYEQDHIDPLLLAMSASYFIDKNLKVAHNTPFSGSIVPMKHYHKDTRIQSLMIEINRALYMNEQNGEKLESFNRVNDLIQGFFDLLISADDHR